MPMLPRCCRTACDDAPHARTRTQGLMVAFYFGASQVDVFIAKQQRRQLGLCEQCGGLYEPGTCAQAGCPLKAGGGSGAAGGGGANGGS